MGNSIFRFDRKFKTGNYTFRFDYKFEMGNYNFTFICGSGLRVADTPGSGSYYG